LFMAGFQNKKKGFSLFLSSSITFLAHNRSCLLSLACLETARAAQLPPPFSQTSPLLFLSLGLSLAPGQPNAHPRATSPSRSQPSSPRACKATPSFLPRAIIVLQPQPKTSSSTLCPLLSFADSMGLPRRTRCCSIDQSLLFPLCPIASGSSIS
jgi:hypothetical protein